MSSTGSKRARSLPQDDGEKPVVPSTVLHEPSPSAEPPLQPPGQATVISKHPPVGAPQAAVSGPTAELIRELAGQTLEHFELQQFVGGGGMGAVFQALDTRLNRTVALKVLSRQQGADPETSRRFLNEAQSAARLDHPHIARVYYVGEDRGWHFIALEYIEGSNVRDLVERHGPLPAAESVRYVLQLAEALAHASSRDVVHRDIKPSNVLITPGGAAKLVDMGLARLHQVEHSGGDLTASGVTLGTFDYISPEQARDPRGADARSDIYSLGCSWYYMLTGQPPFPEGTVLQKLLQHQGDAPPDPRAVRPDLPDEAVRILLQMMAKDPRDRFQTPNELIGALVGLANQLGIAPQTFGELVYVPQPRDEGSWLSRQLPWLAPVGLLLLLVAGLQLLGQWDANSLPAARSTTDRSGPTEAPGRLDLADRTTTAEENAQPQAAPEATAGPAEATQAAMATAGSTDNPAPVGRRGTATVTTASQGGLTSLEIEPSSAVVELAATSAQVTAADARRRPTGAPNRDTPAAGAAEKPAPTAIADSPPAAGQRAADRGVLAVGNDQTAGDFPSLWAACAAARSGDIIELRFDGRRVERPVALTNVDLTIRAGEGYSPVVVFRPRRDDPIGAPRDMLRIAGGRLNLVHVACEMELPVDGAPSENWSLVALEGAEAVQVQDCAWTVYNAGTTGQPRHVHVSLFDVRPPAGAMPGAAISGGAISGGTVPAGAPREIRWEDSCARGEADFLRLRDAAALDVELQNAWLALGQRMAVVEDPGAGPLRLQIQHATIHSRQGVCHVTNMEQQNGAPRVSVSAANTIFVGGPDAAVTTEAAAAHSSVRWKSDRCIYEAFDAFTRSGGNGAPVKETRWSEWRAFWGGGRDVWGAVGWRRPLDEDRPMHERTPDEYAPGSRSPAQGAATDSGDIGMLTDALPSFGSPVEQPPADADSAAE